MKYNLSNDKEQIFIGPMGKDISNDNSSHLHQKKEIPLYDNKKSTALKNKKIKKVKNFNNKNYQTIQYSNSFNQNRKYDEYQRRIALTEKIEKEKSDIRYFADKINYSFENLVNYMKNQTDAMIAENRAMIAENRAMIAENRAMRLDNTANRENNNQMLKTMIIENRRIFQEMRNENNPILFGFAHSGGRIDLKALNNFNI